MASAPPPTARAASAVTTLGALRRGIAGRLRESHAAAGTTPELDARLLVAAAVGVPPSALPLHDAEPADPGVTARADAFAERRARGEPVARILGRKEFWGLDLAVSPDTLVPRPDTEAVVTAALEFVAARKTAPLRILDLGTGSGAILLALLSELRSATGIGVDVAPGALATARENAVRTGLASRARFIVSDWTASVADEASFDLVVANPPYIASGDIAGLDAAVREHDPLGALDGGPDGLDAIRAVVIRLDRVLAVDGGAFIEIGAGQAEAVAGLGREQRFAVAFRKDLGGIDRVAILTRRR